MPSEEVEILYINPEDDQARMAAYMQKIAIPFPVLSACDTPFFPQDLTKRLSDALAGGAAAIAMAETPDGRHPTFALWPVALGDDLEASLTGGVRKIIAWSDGHGCARVMFDGATDPFFNVNTPDDMARAEIMVRELGE